jgi:hypothetical protein
MEKDKKTGGGRDRSTKPGQCQLQQTDVQQNGHSKILNLSLFNVFVGTHTARRTVSSDGVKTELPTKQGDKTPHLILPNYYIYHPQRQTSLVTCLLTPGERLG